jgi:L-rhamnose mutarotase
MYRSSLTFALKPGCYAEYKKAHDELWPEIATAMHENGVSMVIHYYEDRLFLFATAPNREAMEKSHAGEVMVRWQAYMATLMVTGADGKTIVDQLQTAFVFGDFADGDDPL